MGIYRKTIRIFSGSLLVLIAALSLGATGCTVYTNGMTLPNPYYHKNKVQYFPRGEEFPFPNEAAKMQESTEEHQFH
jgi:hypothetical protein